jgi:hypothetical protein
MERRRLIFSSDLVKMGDLVLTADVVSDIVAGVGVGGLLRLWGRGQE